MFMFKLSDTRRFQNLKASLRVKKPSPALTELYIEANRNARDGLEGRFITACVQEDQYEQAMAEYMPSGANYNDKASKLYICSESLAGSESHSLNNPLKQTGKRAEKTTDVKSEAQSDISENPTLVPSESQSVVLHETPRKVLSQSECMGFSLLLLMGVFSAIFGRLGVLLLATVGLFTFIVIYWIRR